MLLMTSCSLQGRVEPVVGIKTFRSSTDRVADKVVQTTLTSLDADMQNEIALFHHRLFGLATDHPAIMSGSLCYGELSRNDPVVPDVWKPGNMFYLEMELGAGDLTTFTASGSLVRKDGTRLNNTYLLLPGEESERGSEGGGGAPAARPGGDEAKQIEMAKVATSVPVGGKAAHPTDRETVVRHLFKQLAEGVAHMHKHGMCHRDLKLENIIISKQMTLQIIDFGSGE